MTAYLKQAPTGIPGDITRTDESNVEPAMLVGVGSPAVYPTAYGLAMKYVTGGIQQFNGGAETAASFAGVLVREVPSISSSIACDSSFDTVSPMPTEPVGLCVRGYVSVKCLNGTPARGGVVYVRIIANGPLTTLGGFEAASDSSNSVALSATQAEWASDGVDSLGNAELRIMR